MALKFLLGQSQINLADGINYRINGTITLSPLELTSGGQRKQRAGLPLLDGDYKNRTMSWQQKILGSTQDVLRSNYQALRQELNTVRNTFVFNSGGATESDSTVVFFSSYPVPAIDTLMVASHRDVLDIKIEIRPFAVQAQIDLPENLIVDPAMWADNNADGICNSFVASVSGAPPTHTLSIAGEWQEIDVTAGGANNEYAGVSQTFAVTAGQPYSFSLRYKTSATLTNCHVTARVYYNDGANTIQTIFDTATPSASETYISLPNQTAPGGASPATQATLYIWVIGTAAGMVGTLYVKKALAINAASIPVGLDGQDMWWTTHAAEGPNLIQFDNVPGDFPALARISMVNSGPDANADRLIIGQRDKSLGSGVNLAHKLNTVECGDFNYTGGGAFKGRSAIIVNAGSLGGEYLNFPAAGWYVVAIIPNTWAGIYTIYVKLQDDATTRANTIYDIEVLTYGDWPVVNNSNIALNPNAGWNLLLFNNVSIPPKSVATGASTGYTVIALNDHGNANGATTVSIDYVCLVPARRQVLAAGGVDSFGNQPQKGGVMSDSITSWMPDTNHQIGSGPGLFFPHLQYNPSGAAITYPVVPAQAYPPSVGSPPWRYDNNGTPLMLDPGTNEMVGLIYETTVQATNYPFSVSTSLLPRYLFTP